MQHKNNGTENDSLASDWAAPRGAAQEMTRERRLEWGLVSRQFAERLVQLVCDALVLLLLVNQFVCKVKLTQTCK